MPVSLPIEGISLTAGPRAIVRRVITHRFMIATAVFALFGFLALAAWRELVTEIHASLDDFAVSLQKEFSKELR